MTQHILIVEDEVKLATLLQDDLTQSGFSATMIHDGFVKMLQLGGDLDLYGDGTIVIKRWVAHTPGSQMMTVRLKNTGLVILTGDNVYFRENVEKNLPPNIVLAYNPTGFLTAYEWIRYMMATEKADFFTAHDPDAFKAMKKAPEFYD